MHASGTQHTLRRGGLVATIASVGASLRSLTSEGRDLVVPFDADEVRPLYRGALLAPWPNRVVDGTYELGGVTHRLPITEHDRGHALHGLVAWLDFEIVRADWQSVRLGATIQPQDGYPWRVRVETELTLADDGLRQTVTATNLSRTAAPYGVAAHPYLVAGEGRVDDWRLRVPAASVLEVDERLAPTSLVPVGEAGLDHRVARRIGTQRIDHAFTQLERGGTGDDGGIGGDGDGSTDGTGGIAAVDVLAPDGSGVRMSWDAACPWVQIHTADRPEPQLDRIGLAVEPMTCAPDAFRSGDGLVLLEPGATHEASWTIEPLPAP